MNSYTSENKLMIHKPKCEIFDITTIRTSDESHLHRKYHFHWNPFYFRIYADFEAANKVDISSISNKTINFFKQNPGLNGYSLVSELEVVLHSGYNKFPLDYDNVDWFVKENIKLEIKMAFYFKNTKKDIITTEKVEEYYRNTNICRFCEKNIKSNKARDHCHLTRKTTEAQLKANVKIMSHTKKNNNFHLFFTISVIMIVIYFLKIYLIGKMLE